MALSIPSGVPLSEIPVGRPPPGVEPNLINPPTREATNIVITSIMVFLSTTFVIGRVYLNHKNKSRKLGWDDAFCVIGWILSIGVAGIQLSLTKYWRHDWDIPLSWYDASDFKRNYAILVLSGLAQFFSKASLLLLYMRLFSISRGVYYVLHCAIVFTFGLWWTNIPLYSYYCAPRPGQPWTLIEISERCAKSLVLAPVQGSLNVFLDLFILFTPISVIVNLKMSQKRKIGVLAAFMTGILAIVASVTSLVYKIIIWRQRSGDDSWYGLNTSICGNVEINVSLVCSSMPAFASLSKHHSSISGYLSSIRYRLLNLLHLSSKPNDLSTLKSTQDSKKMAATKKIPHPYDIDESQIQSHDYLELQQSSTGRGSFVTNMQGSMRDVDLEHGNIMESVSLQQLAPTMRPEVEGGIH